LEGRGREGKAYGEVDPCMKMFWGVLKGFMCPILKFPKLEFWGVKHTN